MTEKVSVHKKLCFSCVGPPVDTLTNGLMLDVVFSGVGDGKYMVNDDYIDNNEVVRVYFNTGSVITDSHFAKVLIVCTYDDLHNNQIEASLDSGYKFLFKKQTFTVGSADDNDITLEKDEAGPNDMTVTMEQGGTFHGGSLSGGPDQIQYPSLQCISSKIPLCDLCMKQPPSTRCTRLVLRSISISDFIVTVLGWALLL